MNAPYEQIKGESAKAFEQFKIYRDLGPARTLTDVATVLGKAPAYVGQLSQRWQWVQRARAWDVAEDRAANKARMKAREDMERRHVELACGMQTLALETLQRIAERAEKDRDDGVLSPDALVKFVKVATDLERLSRGSPSEITETTVREEIDYSTLTDEELATLKNVKSKMAKRLGGSGMAPDEK